MHYELKSSNRRFRTVFDSNCFKRSIFLKINVRMIFLNPSKFFLYQKHQNWKGQVARPKLPEFTFKINSFLKDNSALISESALLDAK